MPAFITHSLNYKNLVKKVKPDSKSAFYWGLQGPDLLFYCKFTKKHPESLRIMKMGSLLHSAPIEKTYEAICEYINSLDGYEKSVINSYVCGFIAHNSLDYFAHPYIFFKEKEYMKKFGYSINAMAHNKIESDIDSILWQKMTGERVSKFAIPKECIPIKTVKRYIADFYVYLLARVCSQVVDSKEVFSCFSQTRLLISVLKNEFGIINYVSEFTEKKLSIKARGEISAFVRIENPDESIINMENKEWYNLNKPNEVKTTSFYALYNKSLMISLQEIEKFKSNICTSCTYIPKKIGSFEEGRLKL